MPASTTPIYTVPTPVGSVLITAANTSSQGGGTIGTDIFLAATAGANGAFLREVQFIPTATTPTNTTATVGRVFISTVTSGATTSANTRLVGEIGLVATAADNATTPVGPISVPLNIMLGPNETVLVTNHAAPAANTAWRANVPLGNY